jgi:MFS family permease
MLYLSQILQGASSAILYTVGLAVLVDTVDPKKVGRWLGMAMSFNNFGLVIGPTVGGIVYQKAPLGKIAVFAITMALGVVGIVLRLMIKEQPRSKSVDNAAAFNSVSLRQLVHEDEGSQRGRKDSRPITTTTTVTSVPVLEISPRSEVFHFRHVWVLVNSRRLVAAFIGIFINEM